MKKVMVLTMLSTLLLSGCGISSSEASSEMVIAPANLTIETVHGGPFETYVGDTLQLKVSSTTANAALSVTWATNDSTLATISEYGLLSTHSRGTVEVTAISTIDEAIKQTQVVNIMRTPGYRVLNGDGSIAHETLGLYRAIIYAAQQSKSSNKLVVLDENDQEVFRYTTLEKYYCYVGEKYEKTVTTSTAAATFVKNYKNAYVIDGRGQNYTHLSQTILPHRTNIDGELFSGSYMYAYSQTGTQMGTTGFGYVKFTVKMSQLKMRLNDDMAESGWNAYIFIPIVTTYPWSFCDIGLIHGGGSTPGYWNVVFNNNGNMHSVQDGLATIMEYNEEDDYYYGTEDLILEGYVTEQDYVLNLTNTATGITRTYRDPRPQGLTLNTSTMFVILAASYCPVMSGTKVWDPRAGITMENLRFENPTMKKYRADENYQEEPGYPLMTNAPFTQYTLLQQPDNVTLDYGKDGETNYMEVSIFYDSRERSHL